MITGGCEFVTGAPFSNAVVVGRDLLELWGPVGQRIGGNVGGDEGPTNRAVVYDCTGLPPVVSVW